MSEIQEKYKILQKYLAELRSIAVAFSGGVDSTFLLKVAHEVLGDQVMAITARSCLFPVRELKEAMDFTQKENIRHVLFDSTEFEIDGFTQNPPNRCYLCKSELMNSICEIAQKHHLDHVVDGSNLDDQSDYRPGMIAIREKGILSPLQIAGLSKQEVRVLSKELELPSWNKPSFACLASRFPYGESITIEKLHKIDQAEQFLIDLGLIQVRVRYHGDLARIETDEAGFRILTSRTQRETIYHAFNEIGFAYTAIDLLGYRTGSMNEPILYKEAHVPNQ